MSTISIQVTPGTAKYLPVGGYLYQLFYKIHTLIATILKIFLSIKTIANAVYLFL